MATKKIQLYRRNVDGTETLLNPLTKAKYVTMEDGSMVEEALTNQDSSKYTPNIESSKSVFKVGEGDGVDLSSSVVDGAYNSCVLKGRTLVNLRQPQIYRIGVHTDDTALYTDRVITNDEVTFNIQGKPTSYAYISGGFLNTNLLKPNTKYLVVFGKCLNLKSIEFKRGDSKQTISDVASISNGVAIITTNGMTEADNTQEMWVGFTTSFTTYPQKISMGKVMILEYQESMENWGIEYFDGMCDVKSPILSNCGKNLIDSNKYIIRYATKNVTKTGNSFTFSTTEPWGGIGFKINLKPNTTYYTSFETGASDVIGYVRLGGYSSASGGGKTSFSFTTDSTGLVYYTIETRIALDSATVSNIQLEESSTSTIYEDYKSNILTCETYFDEVSQSDKTIVLRSLPSGVCDTLNVETGEYIQRIGELDFSKLQYNNWAISDSTLTNTISFTWLSTNSSFYNVQNSSDGVCDSIPYKRYSNEDVEHCRFNGSNPSAFVVWVSKSKLGSLDNEGLKNYLKTLSSTKVQYELATPVVKTVNLSGFPYAYKDGHVILSSGSVETSLTPKVEYSLVANRNGQIEANTKRVLAHQKEIDDFEALMLTQMVQSHYEKTLLQFDYEMPMMTLKGE